MTRKSADELSPSSRHTAPLGVADSALANGEADFDASGTNIAGDLLLMIQEVERSLDRPVRSTRIAGEPRGVIKGWRIEVPGVGVIKRPEDIIGANVCTPTGNTSAITAFDGDSRRVQTISGSVYELGMPDAYYAAHNRRVLKALGF
ncbi:hypothetical protein GCM10025771_16910 [Niveibacterium umoris]|uniref:Uncharacterized protein n=1 Tax=Niveibacterium umoris TaxID=1193620 RepID=A0A840BN87_9RHOO|nr:hypothetical protein [Niveibacterium umoris]MBB4014440.1 hypothetical protein [Niveibacterium umoris]